MLKYLDLVILMVIDKQTTDRRTKPITLPLEHVHRVSIGLQVSNTWYGIWKLQTYLLNNNRSMGDTIHYASKYLAIPKLDSHWWFLWQPPPIQLYTHKPLLLVTLSRVATRGADENSSFVLTSAPLSTRNSMIGQFVFTTAVWRALQPKGCLQLMSTPDSNSFFIVARSPSLAATVNFLLLSENAYVCVWVCVYGCYIDRTV